MRAVCRVFDCDDWLIMSQGSVIRHLWGRHADINERLPVANVHVCLCGPFGVCASSQASVAELIVVDF